MSPNFVLRKLQNFVLSKLKFMMLIYQIRIYRSPAGNFNLFLNLLDATLKHLYKPKMEFLLCGDLNVNYLIDR